MEWFTYTKLFGSSCQLVQLNNNQVISARVSSDVLERVVSAQEDFIGKGSSLEMHHYLRGACL